MAYTKWFSDWLDADSATGGGTETTPIDQAALDHIEAGIATAAATADAALSGTATNATAISNHLADQTSAHAATAISVADAGAYYTGVNVESVLQEIGPQLGGGTTAVTALPGSPSDGDEIMFTDSLTAGTYHWHLRYVSGRASNKWVFIGGASMFSAVNSSESTTSTTYTDLTTSGPSVTLPVAGDYFIHFGALINGGTDNAQPVASFATSAAASDTNRIEGAPVSAEQTLISASRKVKMSGLTAAAVTMKYKVTSAGSGTYNFRWLAATPIAIGG